MVDPTQELIEFEFLIFIEIFMTKNTENGSISLSP
jgi:hypothetical protein